MGCGSSTGSAGPSDSRTQSVSKDAAAESSPEEVCLNIDGVVVASERSIRKDDHPGASRDCCTAQNSAGMKSASPLGEPTTNTDVSTVARSPSQAGNKQSTMLAPPRPFLLPSSPSDASVGALIVSPTDSSGSVKTGDFSEDSADSGNKESSKRFGSDRMKILEDRRRKSRSQAPPKSKGTALPLRCDTPEPTTLKLHRVSRLIPRKFTSSFDRHYRGSFEDKDHPERKILPPDQRLQAQRRETATKAFGAAEGLAWPVEVQARQQAVVQCAPGSSVAGPVGDSEVTVLPLSAIRDELLLNEEVVVTINLRRHKRNREAVVEEVEKMLVSLATCVESRTRIGEFSSACDEASLACQEVGLQKLSCVISMLGAISTEVLAIDDDPDEFIATVHRSVASHFEGEFDEERLSTLETQLTHAPSHGDLSKLLSIEQSIESASVEEKALEMVQFEQETHLSSNDRLKMIDQYATYIEDRMYADMRYCIDVAQQLVDGMM